VPRFLGTLIGYQPSEQSGERSAPRPWSTELDEQLASESNPVDRPGVEPRSRPRNIGDYPLCVRPAALRKAERPLPPHAAPAARQGRLVRGMNVIAGERSRVE